MFQNIPSELRAYKQWVLWRLEIRQDAKDTKVPYNFYTGQKASVTNPNDWCNFADIWQLSFPCREAVDPSTPVSESGFSGIGFVFTKIDPYSGIDLDDTHGDEENYARQLKIYNDFESYSEFSQSGQGLHIICRGEVPTGRRRSSIEMYSSERYFAITGNVYGNRFEITDQQENLTRLYNQMGSAAVVYTVEDKEEKQTDAEIIEIALNAENGDKFKLLHNGEWNTLYPSQSEADFAYVDIIAYYTQNRAQIRRLFRKSKLGQTPKDNYKHRGDRPAYVEYMVNKSFDRQLPWIDLEGLHIPTKEILNVEPVSDNTQYNNASSTRIEFPPGLLGDIAFYIYSNSPTPVKEIALAGAIGLMAGICGRAYNISGTGLNQYILLLAQTGTGKEAMSDGINQLLNAVKQKVPAVIDFKGPGEIASAPALARCFERTPCIFSILGEFGLTLSEMANPRAGHLLGLKRMLLHLFNKSGKGNVFDATVYSDKMKNIPNAVAPSFTIVGESTPQAFYSSLSENMIELGVLPRFTIIEYKGKVPYYDKSFKKLDPPFELIDKITSLAAICLGRQAQNQVENVQLDEAATELFDNFSRYCTDQQNESDSEVTQHLFSRANMKALKLAGVLAVGINQISPIVTYDIAKYSTDLIHAEVNKLIERFKSGDVGYAESTEGKQMQDLCRVIREYSKKNFDFWNKYGVSEEMYRQGVITQSAIQRRLVATASFRLDVKQGATNAIAKQLKSLLEADDLKEVPKVQMQANFNTTARAFVVSNPKRFIPE